MGEFKTQKKKTFSFLTLIWVPIGGSASKTKKKHVFGFRFSTSRLDRPQYRENETKNQNIRVLKNSCALTIKSVLKTWVKNVNRNLKFSVSLNLDYPSLWEDKKRR